MRWFRIRQTEPSLLERLQATYAVVQRSWSLPDGGGHLQATYAVVQFWRCV